MGFLKALFLRECGQYCEGLYIWSDDMNTYIAPTRWSTMVLARDFFDAVSRLKIHKEYSPSLIALYARLANTNGIRHYE